MANVPESEEELIRRLISEAEAEASPVPEGVPFWVMPPWVRNLFCLFVPLCFPVLVLILICTPLQQWTDIAALLLLGMNVAAGIYAVEALFLNLNRRDDSARGWLWWGGSIGIMLWILIGLGFIVRAIS